MKRGSKDSYTKKFREQAVKLVLVDGLTQREAAGRLSMSVKTLGSWIVAANKGSLSKIGKTEQRTPTDLEAELTGSGPCLICRQVLLYRALRNRDLLNQGFASGLEDCR